MVSIEGREIRPVRYQKGSPYTSQGYQRKLVERQIVVSMSNVGECDDNAAMERVRR